MIIMKKKNIKIKRLCVQNKILTGSPMNLKIVTINNYNLSCLKKNLLYIFMYQSFICSFRPAFINSYRKNPHTKLT